MTGAARVIAEPTHVIVWVPAYLDKDGEGYWELLTIEDFDDAAGRPAYAPQATCVPEDFTERTSVLRAWAAERLGGMVWLYPGWRQLRKSRLSPWRSEPVFWVCPEAR